MSNTQQSTPEELYTQIYNLLNAAQTNVARSVNTAQVLSNWLIGRTIVEEEQHRQPRADYGDKLLKNLTKQLKQDFGVGYSYSNLKFIRQFYIAFPTLLNESEIGYAVSSQSLPNLELVRLSTPAPNWQPRQLHPNLPWTHYRTLMRVEKLEVRAFYEIQKPADVFKDPVVIEFLGLPESPRLSESNLKTALISYLQAFLLELGRGFAFVN
jgi:DUF1016 N-terminal domain/YhcG PDDEXK nuclease domain